MLYTIRKQREIQFIESPVCESYYSTHQRQRFQVALFFQENTYAIRREMHVPTAGAFNGGRLYSDFQNKPILTSEYPHYPLCI